MGNLAKTWPNINVLILSDADSCKQINLKENDKLLKSDIDLAETFNSYFSTVARDLEIDMPMISISPMTFMGTHYPCRTQFFYVNSCTSVEVQKIIRTFENKSCPWN